MSGVNLTSTQVALHIKPLVARNSSKDNSSFSHEYALTTTHSIAHTNPIVKHRC